MNTFKPKIASKITLAPGQHTADMPNVKVYTAGNCCYCHMAKELLRRKGVTYEEIDVTGRSDLRSELNRRSGRTTVPQIWIGETHVGGCDDLHQLERDGKLDLLLTRTD